MNRVVIVFGGAAGIGIRTVAGVLIAFLGVGVRRDEADRGLAHDRTAVELVAVSAGARSTDLAARHSYR